MALVSAEYAVRDYELLQAELRSLQWRTIVLLLGSTFLTLFWFSSVVVFLKMTDIFRILTAFRTLTLLPLFVNGCVWLVWLAPSLWSQFEARHEFYVSRGSAESMEDIHYLERIQVLQLQLRRSRNYGRIIQELIALEFTLIPIATAGLLIRI